MSELLEKKENKAKVSRVAKKVMTNSRNSLIVHMRFLDRAINKLALSECSGYLQVDGRQISYNPYYLLRRYQIDQNFATRAYLHMILHCTFIHFYVGPRIYRELWDIACDIAVENIIDELSRTEDYLKEIPDPEKQETLRRIRREVPLMTAEKIYRYLDDKDPDFEEAKKLYSIFTVDDHSVWYENLNNKPTELQNPGKEPEKNQMEQEDVEDEEPSPEDDGGLSGNMSDGKQEADRQTDSGQDQRSAEGEEQDKIPPDSATKQMLDEWEDVAKHMDIDLETFSKEKGSRVGDLLLNIKNVTREKYNYASFLKKFASLGEKMKVSEDEFDYVYYTYGLSLYQNMPLVEPLEYREQNLVREFVIAIDTSFSVHGDEVQSFIRKTYNILKSTESFSSEVNLHIIQRDVKVQHDEKITSMAQLDSYVSDMLLYGFGGTNFRPVFEYVDDLIKKGEFTNLRGLIYFTDGYGDFPERPPKYRTAFAFVSDDPTFDPKVPPWAIKLIFTPDEIKEK